MDHEYSKLHPCPTTASVVAVHPYPAKPEMNDLRRSLSRLPVLASPMIRLLIILRMKRGVAIGERDEVNQRDVRRRR